MSDAVVRRLGEALAQAAGERELIAVIIYAPFGIVRAEVAQAQVRDAARLLGEDGGVIELQRATVEHYSNHLPTGNYESLYLNLREISGFVIIKD